MSSWSLILQIPNYYMLSISRILVILSSLFNYAPSFFTLSGETWLPLFIYLFLTLYVNVILCTKAYWCSESESSQSFVIPSEIHVMLWEQPNSSLWTSTCTSSLTGPDHAVFSASKFCVLLYLYSIYAWSHTSYSISANV